MNKSHQLLVSRRRVAAAFPPARATEYVLKACGFTVLFYALYFALAVGFIGAWPFLIAGPFILTRSFNALHETFHVGTTGLSFLNWFAIVVGPLQVGYDQFRRGHHSHHSDPGGVGDIDAYLVRGSLPGALLQALVQPEQAVFRYLAHQKFDARLGMALALNASLFVTMMVFGWGWPVVCYVITTRVGNTFTWFVFHRVLHHSPGTHDLSRMRIPRLLGILWWVGLGPDSLKGATHHELHHAYPAVPDSKLPRLLQWLRASTGQMPLERRA